MKTLAVLLCFIALQTSKAQSLLQELEEDNKKNDLQTEYVEGTFKSVKLINGQTSETTEKRGLNFIISHRFSPINNGIYDFFGIDMGSMRLGLEYGLTDRISLGYGRGNEQKLYDAYFKIRLLRQSSGIKNMPVSLSFYSDMAVKTQEWWISSVKEEFKYRASYVHEFIIARKFSPKMSAQLIAGILHRNLVKTNKDQNTIPFTGIGGRALISNRLALTGEYYYHFANNFSQKMTNSLSVGIDIETGGHVFQLHLSNSIGMTEKVFIAENTNTWDSGEINIGFNIIRTFKF